MLADFSLRPRPAAAMFNVALTPELPSPRESDFRANPSKPYVMMAGFLGTMIAGGLFPGPFMFIDSLFNQGSHWGLDDLGFLVPGFPVGAIFAGVVATPVFLFLGFAHHASALGSPVLVASIAGGWAGAFAASAPGLRMSFEQGLTLEFTAMVMGHVGAGLLARVVERSAIESKVVAKPSFRLRITLRQLFVVTTFTAVFAATFAGMPLAPRAKEGVLICLAVQATTIAAFLTLRSVRAGPQRRNGVSPMELVASDVPRETTAAANPT